MATRLQRVEDVGERMASMEGLIKKYLATLTQADATYMARLMYTQLNERDVPDMASIAISMTDVLIRRGKLFKAFWDAIHNNLISNDCPSCVARGIRESWGGSIID